MALPTTITAYNLDDATTKASAGLSLTGSHTLQAVNDVIRLGPPAITAGGTYPYGVNGICFTEDNTSVSRTGVQFFRREDGSRVAIAGLNFDVAQSVLNPNIHPRVCPLPSCRLGYAVGYYKGSSTIEVAFVRADVASRATIDVPGTELLSMTPASRPINSEILVGVVRSSGEQLQVLEEIINESKAGSLAGTAQQIYAKEYNNGSYSGWGSEWSATSNRPTAVLAAQQLPRFGPESYQYSNGVILVGVHAAAATHDYVTKPALAVCEGVTHPAGGTVLQSHAPHASLRAHGMVVDQEGFVYTCGTGDFVTGAAGDKLICKYPAWDLTTLTASVAHEANREVGEDGLGDGHASAANTIITRPMWTGTHLCVLDIDSAKTRMFVYNKDLTFVDKYTVHTSGSSHARVFGGTFTGTFWRDNY